MSDPGLPQPCSAPRAPAHASRAFPPTAPCDSYREGFHACLARLSRVVPACHILEPALSARLLEHLRLKADPEDGCAGDSRGEADPEGGCAGDSRGAPSASPTPAPMPLLPAPPGGLSLWRPW